jgi:hypothetical protein
MQLRVRVWEVCAAVCIPLIDKWCARWQAHHLMSDRQRLELEKL